jgi:hypothetical protein
MFVSSVPELNSWAIDSACAEAAVALRAIAATIAAKAVLMVLGLI